MGIELKFKSHNTESKQKEILFYVYVMKTCVCEWVSRTKTKIKGTIQKVRINCEIVTSACALRG